MTRSTGPGLGIGYLEKAQQRCLRACDELAKVRKMLRPTQVNIGVNQVNVTK